jgi:hypothetical protein
VPVEVVRSRAPLPEPGQGPSVFLAGPTPKAAGAPSWRPAAIELISARWTAPRTLSVLSPEDTDFRYDQHFDVQVDWETEARAQADVILFWIPRDVRAMPGYTTNVEFGLDVATVPERVVLGCPPDCPSPEHNRYLISVAKRRGVPVLSTLAETVSAALALIAGSAGR